MDLTHRADYDWGVLVEDDADADPFVQLRRWLDEAEAAGEPEFNSMALSTVDGEGRPTSRNVLLRGIDEESRLQFFTNLVSRKGRELAGNPNVCLLFSWLGQHRQVRIEGTAVVLPDDVSDEYFASRPLGSRIGAWASEQSAVLADRAELEARVAEATARFGEGPVPRPPHWGGYGVTPQAFEFWQGRPSRLHDRLRYRRAEPGEAAGAGAWVVERLSP
jgi:pyridoxamine 5'-phosphate oxidase